MLKLIFRMVAIAKLTLHDVQRPKKQLLFGSITHLVRGTLSLHPTRLRPSHKKARSTREKLFHAIGIRERSESERGQVCSRGTENCASVSANTRSWEAPNNREIMPEKRLHRYTSLSWQILSGNWILARESGEKMQTKSKLSMLNSFTFAFLFGLLVYSRVAIADQTTSSPGRVALPPDALLSIDMNRNAVIERIMLTWQKEIPTNQLTDLKAKLGALRADSLLAANISGTFDGVLEVLASHESAARFASASATQSAALNSADRAKALGELARDLLYTPVTPCRIADSRSGSVGGLTNPLMGGALYSLPGNRASGGAYIDWGGSTTDCGLSTTEISALVLVINYLRPNSDAYLGMSDQNSLPTVLANAAGAFTNNQYSSNTYVVPQTTSKTIYFALPVTVTVNVTIEVVGYFTPPTRNGDGLRIRASSVANTPNTVNGSSANQVGLNVRGATIAGGGIPGGGNTDPDYGGEGPNRVTDNYGSIGGGYGNRTGNDNDDGSDAAFATIGGGNNNVAQGSNSTVGGGNSNAARGFISTVSGGEGNLAIDSWSYVGGGRFNTANGLASMVGGGQSNASNGAASVVMGGQSNNASGPQSTTGGGSNNTASGAQSTVPGGIGNLAGGSQSFAAGRKANALSDGCFVWGDSLDAVVECTTPNAFVARARGGVSFITGGTLGSYTGALLPSGSGAWTTLSDANAKTEFRVVDVRKILEKVVRLPIMSWQYKAQDTRIRHIGPTAQAFKQSFKIGESDRGISTVDADGIALAAIQGLNAKIEAHRAQLEQRESKIRNLEQANVALRRELEAIKKKVGL
jgi:hypothetical protein